MYWNCKYCLFGYCCPGANEKCSHYTPVDQDPITDAMIDRIVRAGYKDYQKAYDSYVAEFN